MDEAKKICLADVSPTCKNIAIVQKCYLQCDDKKKPYASDLYIALKDTTQLAKIRVNDWTKQKALVKVLHSDSFHMAEIQLIGLNLYQTANKIYGYADTYIILEEKGE